MEHLNRYDGIDPRVLKHIRATARRLARQHAVPGMDAQDLEQDLVLDLWCRMEAFDPARASFRKLGGRVVYRLSDVEAFEKAQLQEGGQ